MSIDSLISRRAEPEVETGKEIGYESRIRRERRETERIPSQRIRSKERKEKNE
jgi:hypothetical protein